MLSNKARGDDSDTFVGLYAGDNTSGSYDTGVGFLALAANTSGSYNTATGALALYSNSTGPGNTAIGYQALAANTTNGGSTATGYQALYSNTGYANTADGYQALYSNTSGLFNVASGSQALLKNTTANNNTATGFTALSTNVIGHDNVADGFQALLNNKGSNNVGLGSNAGKNLTTGSSNIIIGANVLGASGDTSVTRIGNTAQKKTFIGGISGKTVASGVGVIVNSSGQLGTVQSSARFKDDIRPMAKASEAILALKPVTFRYKKELDSEKIPQFGLIAEQVEQIDPDLVVRDEDGNVTTVRYEAVNAMLLNEFLKEHRQVEEQKRLLQHQASEIAQMKQQLRTLTTRVNEVSD